MAISIERVFVTRKYAESLLSENFKGNRNINRSHVKELADDMVNGRWVETNDMICINDKGELINGQHRLTAVVESGVPCYFVIATGFPSESFNAMDTGTLTRSFKDQMKQISDDPLKRNSNIVSFIKNIVYAELGIEKDKMSVQKANEIIDKYYGACDFVYRLNNTTHKHGKKSTSSINVACVCAAIYGVKRETLADFFKVLRSNDIDITKSYNYKAALDYTQTLQNEMLNKKGYSSVIRSSMSNPTQKTDENIITKKVLWCFVNNKKRLPQYDPYPITEEDLKKFSDSLLLGKKGA